MKYRCCHVPNAVLPGHHILRRAVLKPPLTQLKCLLLFACRLTVHAIHNAQLIAQNTGTNRPQFPHHVGIAGNRIVDRIGLVQLA